ncbi:LysM peptidoglycan-binding domain-containing protein [Lachnoclostridium sp. An14]|uniref:LysM peptidoglycan-binding domain-containing protein n=1 Tax=Lachnoclostridium sp. An14 TaxID=1965562 RepID=UPI001FA8AE02|nr:LysM peptidoglycan-binding domain-containing protein [Lachnoclostridium sp. An14]
MKHRRRIKGILVICLIICMTVFGSCLMDALAKDTPHSAQRYYKSMQIKAGDSLWSLAKEYSGGQMPLEDYVKELRSMNGLTSDTIHRGQYLTILYFE